MVGLFKSYKSYIKVSSKNDNKPEVVQQFKQLKLINPNREKKKAPQENIQRPKQSKIIFFILIYYISLKHP